MRNNLDSFPSYFTFKKTLNSIDQSYSDKYKSYLTYNRYDNNNNVLNSVDFYTHKDFHSPKRIRRINSTYGTDFLQNKKYISKIGNNTKEVEDEEIKLIIESIESIKQNQNEILSIIKELKSNKSVDTKVNDKNIINVEKKEQTKNDEINELKNCIKKLNEEFSSMKKEILILKKNDEENKKIIESYKNEIESLKNNQQNDVSINDILQKKDEEIKQLKESLNKSEAEKKDLNLKLAQSQNQINNFKDEKINNFENELKQMNDRINNIISKTTKIEEILDNSPTNLFKDNIKNNDIAQIYNQNPIKSDLQQSTSIANQSYGKFIENNNKITIQEENNE
jgi:DNA repair exonuclease SbcCD ATPase subunit